MHGCKNEYNKIFTAAILYPLKLYQIAAHFTMANGAELEEFYGFSADYFSLTAICFFYKIV